METHTPIDVLEKATKQTMDAFPGKTFVTTDEKGKIEEVRQVAPILDTDPQKATRENKTFRQLEQEEPPLAAVEQPTTKDPQNS